MRNFYGCSGYRENGCKFSIHTQICRGNITVEQVRQLLSVGKTDIIDGFVSQRTGKAFRAALRLDHDRVVFDFGQTNNISGRYGENRSAELPMSLDTTPSLSYSSKNFPPQEENPFPPSFYEG